MEIKCIIGTVLLTIGTVAALSPAAYTADNPESKAEYRLLLRIDDIGMNHATNMALRDLIETGIPFSASVMFTCPWYQEAVEILKANRHIAVGVHLTLNAEWKYYRWGPVLGPEAVPSLVNEEGYFYPSTVEFLEADYKPDDVKRELRAQIERALSTGLDIEYVDFHMRTAIATPELEQSVFDLAKEYNLRLSMYMNEAYKTLFDTPIDEKKTEFLDHINNMLEPEKINLVIVHAARAHPEMQVLVDLNNPIMNTEDGRPLVASHRQAELDIFLSEEVQEILRDGRFHLITYRDVTKQ
jgi:chitin disaccharide deacetylase